jgi:Putative Flp pilus-assembly TadE/G-like
VLVLVAAAIFPIVGMMTFAIDVSHWFDYSRNLQNRADAAALAGGQMLGSCIGKVGDPGNTVNGLQGLAGKWAQLYTGASVGESGANRPYTDQQVSAATTDPVGSGNGPGTGWTNLATQGYINNTLPPSPVNSPLTLRAGLANINNFWVALNASGYSPSGGANTSFTLAAPGTPSTFCSSDPTYDTTDAQCKVMSHGQTTGPCQTGPMVDVKLTQQNIPLFIPLFSSTPTVHAHARVTLQGEASSPDIRPVAVADPGSFACATVFFRRLDDNNLVGNPKGYDLTQTDPANFVWENATATSFDMPSDGTPVYMQVFLSDCRGNGILFDGDSTPPSGIELISSYDTGTAVAGQPPKITSVVVNGTNFHGVTLSGNCPAPTDQYFSSGGCKVQPQAVVSFSAPKNDDNVTALDLDTGNSLNLSPDSTGTIWTPNGNLGFTIGDQTGLHHIKISWSQKSGTINGTTCGTGSGQQPPPCTGTFGVQAWSFGACNGCDDPDDSGPIVTAQLHLSGDTTGDNSFQQGSTPPLFIRLQLAGIRADTSANAKPTILRFAGSTNHQTGLIDCGQGTSGNGDTYTVYGGCGPNNPFECATGCKLPILNPLYIYNRGPGPTDCSPEQDPPAAIAYTGWPGGDHQDCVVTTPGTRRVNIICALLQRITGVTTQNFNPGSNACNSNFAATCPYNYWPNPDTLGDKDLRKVTFVLTSPVDLASNANPPPLLWIPIRRFATFYITGWDTSLFPNCGNSGKNGQNDPFPGAVGGKASQNGAIWGHWIDDVDVGGIPNGVQCDTSSGEPTNCVPALTR